MSDKERIQMVMDHYQLNNANFCTKVGLNQATLSNILGGRTNPSLQVLRSIIDAFPEINPNWMFIGDDEMFKSQQSSTNDSAQPSSSPSGVLFRGVTPSGSEDLFSALSTMTSPSSVGQQSPSSSPQHTTTPSPKMSPISVSEIVTGVVTQLQKPTRKIKEVRIFFDDGTYEVFS